MEIPKTVKEKFDVAKIDRHPKSICIANYKGGVGKTTVTTLLGYFLAHKGNKVLLFDIDPQCSLSLAVGFEPEAVAKTDYTIYHLVTPNKWHNINKVKFLQYIDSAPDIYAPKSLNIIKGAFNVDELDIEITRAIVENEGTDDMLFSYCRNMLNSFKDYDYILVDCPPNKMYLTQAMLRACSYFLTVTIPDKISIYGMPRLLRWVKEIPQNEKPKLLGVALNAVNRSGGNEFGTINQQTAISDLLSAIQKDLDATEKKVIGEHPIITTIPRLDVVSKFLSQGAEKIAWFDLRHSASEQRSVSETMWNFVGRIEKRINDYAQS
ncbi:MAG: AAA family ATPase [Chitinophagaceae bacterium]|nr:AAA family ATPase [Chitinophagaceae bacterium]